MGLPYYCRTLLTLLLSLLPCVVLAAAELSNEPSKKIIRAHAIAMHDQPKYSEGFRRFDYTSPDAVKGGELRLYAMGTYDSLNPYIAKGTPAEELGLIYDSLTVPSADEPYTQYGLLAKSMEYPEDRSWIIFHLNPKARWHDGKPVTADDVVFSFHLLLEQGNPFYSFYYADVEAVEVLDRLRVKFRFKPDSSREMVMIAGQLPVLPKHYWESRDFSRSSLEIPLGSGPYRIVATDPGRSIRYEHVPDYWAAEHPTRKGMFNFKSIVVDYYRDEDIALEAFKAGEYDFRYERVSKLWATAYDIPAVRNGTMIREEIPHDNPAGMQAFGLNLRNPLLQDRQLRMAMELAFDFEWTNRNLFYGAYKRTASYFANSFLASSGLPSKAELELLEPFRDQLPAEVFTEAYQPPVSSGTDNNRTNLRKAKQLLDAAGYYVKEDQLYTPDGKAVRFEFMLYDPSFKRITNPFVKSLARLGIQTKVRVVDTSQYINRQRNFDYDIMTLVIQQSLNPGFEQRDYWDSRSAAMEGSRNFMGIANPVVDALVTNVINARTEGELVTATHALDRVLLHMHYVIPHWHIDRHRIAYWNKFSRPEVSPSYDYRYETGLMSWWQSSPTPRHKDH